MIAQGELASRLCERIASVESVRFANSGTEANLLAARIARSITSRLRLAVAVHSYHGSYEGVDWQRAAETGTAVFPVNDVDGTLAALGDGHDLAAIFIEPVLGSGGVIEVGGEFLAFLREFAFECGALSSSTR